MRIKLLAEDTNFNTGCAYNFIEENRDFRVLDDVKYEI